MIYRSPQNPNSHLTVKKRKWPSFPTKQLFLKGLIKGKVLDLGCGLGVDINFLKTNGVEVYGYDPYYKPDYPSEKFDTILCNYVLNILLPEEQAHVLMAVSELLKVSGKAYITVRRDIKRSGFRYNPKHQCKTYQCNVILPYNSIIRTEHCEVYEYQHINLIKKPVDRTTCLFCNPPQNKEIITESATAYALKNNLSSEKEEVLIIPKRHLKDYFDLTFKEQCACWLVLNRVKNLLNKQYSFSEYRIEVSSSFCQTINSDHLYIVLNITKNVQQ